MPFTPSFLVGQSAETPANVTFTDDSSGSDVLITERRIFITDSQGNPVVPSGTITAYIVWALATNPITIQDLLPNDMDVDIEVTWNDVNGGELYSEEAAYPLNENNKQFFFYLFQQQALSPGIVQDANYFSNLAEYWTNIVGSVNITENTAVIAAGQNAINRATYMMQNQNFNF